MTILRPNQQRAKTAIILLWIVFGFEILQIISSYMQYILLNAAANGEIITYEEANANDSREKMILGVSVIVLLISGITFIQWFRRAYYNLHQVTNNLMFSEGWASGAWFVPFLNLVRPFQIMKDLYVRTNELLSNRGIEPRATLDIKILGWWWGLWIANGFLGQAIFRIGRNTTSIDGFINLTIFSIISSIITAINVYLIVTIIRNYSANEPLLKETSATEANLIINDDQNIIA